MKIAELFVRLSADTAGLKRGMAEADTAMSRFGKTAVRVGGLVGAGLFAGIVKNTIEAQNAVAQLNAVVKSTGGAAGFATPQLQAMATGLQKVSTFSDEAIMGAQGLLLTFTRIKGAEFEGATQAVMNLAQAMGGDLNGAAIQVGKALNDPVRGLTALRKAGIQFTESQEATIKKLVQTGQMAKAQQLILAELEVQFGGSAAAARNTLGGALTALKNAFGDLLEVSGESSKGVVGALNSITDAMPTVAERIGSGLDVIRDQFRRFKRDIMALNLGVAWADAQLGFWDADAQKELEKARQKFWQAQDAIDPLTLAPVVVSAPKGSGGNPAGDSGDPAAAAKAAKKAWDDLLGTMRDLLSLQGAMKEARMNTKAVDDQILAAYIRINNEIAKGVRLTNEQKAAAISLRSALAGAMAPLGGDVRMTPMAGRNPTSGIKVKGSNQFDSTNIYGDRVVGRFGKAPTTPPKDPSSPWWKGGSQFGANDSLGTKFGQVLGAGGGGEMGQMVQAFAAFGPMAAVLPVINGAMEKLGPAFSKLIAPLVDLGASIGEMLVPVFEMLAPIVQLVVASMKVFQPVLKMVVKGFSYLMQGLGYAVKAVGKLIDSLPFVSAPGIIRAGQEMIDAAKAARDNADATDEATEALEKFAGALSNIPRVLNINALRHLITGGGTGGGGGGPYAPPTRPGGGGPGGLGGGVVIQQMTVIANNPEEFMDRMGRVAERTATRGGTPRLALALR